MLHPSHTMHISKGDHLMRRFGFIGFLVLALLVGAVGVVAYNAGISTGAADAAIAEGATVVYQPSGWSPLGLVFGLGFLLLIVGFVSKAIFRPRMPYGPGGMGGRHWAGQSDWNHEDVPEPFRPMLEKWHERAHRAPTGSAGGDAAAPPVRPPAPPGPPAR
jgi:hypothetical protein